MFHVSLTVIDLFLTEVALSLKDQHYSIIIVSSSNNDSVTTCHAKVGLSLTRINRTVSISSNNRLLNQYPYTLSIFMRPKEGSI